MPRGKILVAKVGKGVHELRMSGGPEHRALCYGLKFDGKNPENVRMEERHEGPKYPEWPPSRVQEEFALQGVSYAEGADRFRVRDLSKVYMNLWKTVGTDPILENEVLPSFDVAYMDETVEKPKEETLAEGVIEYTWYVSPLANPMVKTGVGVVGVAVATGFIGRWLDWW